jgi:Cd2+/Zn2+-exporting ATPase
VGVDTTLAKIIHRVEEAQDEKAPTQRFIEKFAQWYTPFIIGLSIVAYLITTDIELALTLLVIGCPGALVISTPVSIVAGIGSAAKKGILIKGGEYLENAGKISAIAFDKTGTLTEGKPFVSDVVILNSAQREIHNFNIKLPTQNHEFEWNDDQLRVLKIAAVAESGSEHPLAKAVLQAAGIEVFEGIERFDTITSRGVRVIYEGREIVVGNNQFISDQKIVIPDEVNEHQLQLKSEGKTTILVSIQNYVIGLIAISDRPRKNAMDALKKLQEIGIKTIVMLTGDDHLTANSIAKTLGLSEVKSQLLPEDKLDIIRNLQNDGHIVAMVGDGINDAPALAAANLGIAMGVAGTDVAIETADIALMADDLMKIPEAIRVSKLTLRNIRQNVFIALLTVTALLVGVILGKIHMAGGMFIHEASVLLVILNGMRLLRLA